MQLFHLSFDPNLPNYLKPRQPNGSEQNDVSHFTHEDLPPRVSFAPSIEQCWYAIYANVSKYFEKHDYPYMDMYVYAYSSPHGKEYKMREELLKTKIHDWHITEEVCFLDTVGIIKLGKIRIFNEEPNIEAVMYKPFNDRTQPSRFLAPKMVYYVLERNHKSFDVQSTGYHLYHYSEQQLAKIFTRRKQGGTPDDIVKLAESLANGIGDIGCYLDHISFFLEPIPLDILPKLFKGEHPFYKSDRQLIEHVVRVNLKDDLKYSLQETPVIGTFSDRWKWDDIDSDTRRIYLRKINKEMDRLKLQGTNPNDMFEVIRPYIGRTRDYFIKARSSQWANDTATKYAGEVPHLMLYPKSGKMDVVRANPVKLGSVTKTVTVKPSLFSKIFK